MSAEREQSGVATLDVPPPWLRGPAALDDGWVVLDLERAREYQPSEAGLPYDLAAVSAPADVIAFVQRHGLLRHGPGADEHRERLRDFEEQALGLRYILRVYQELRRGLSEDRGESVEGLRALRGELRPALSDFFEAPASSDEELLAQASVTIAQGISQGLEGVEESVGAAVVGGGSPGLFGFAPRPPDLVGYAYHQLAMAVVSRAAMRTCAECGRFFPVKDRRQRFCTPTCASRARYRRWSKRQSKED